MIFLSGYIMEGDALDPREEDVQVGEAGTFRSFADEGLLGGAR